MSNYKYRPRLQKGTRKHPGRPPKNERNAPKHYMLLCISGGGSELQIRRFRYIEDGIKCMKNLLRPLHKFPKEICDKEEFYCDSFGFNNERAYSIIFDEHDGSYTYRYWYLLDSRKAGMPQPKEKKE